MRTRYLSIGELGETPQLKVVALDRNPIFSHLTKCGSLTLSHPDSSQG